MIIFKEIEDGVFQLDEQTLGTVFTPNSVIERLKTSRNSLFTTAENQRGANCKFWIKNNTIPEGLLFKYSRLRGSKDDAPLKTTFYGEFIVDMIAYHTGLEHTGYYPCEIHMNDGSILVGSLSTNYKQGIYDKEFSAKNIDERYRNSQYDNNDGIINEVERNTVYGSIEQLKYLYPHRFSDERFDEFKDYLLKLSLLDFLTIQIDRHWGNYGWMFNEQEGIKSLTAIPTFDNECCFCLDDVPEKAEAVAFNIKNTKDPMGRIIMPKAGSKKNTPLLGIKTATCVNDKGDRIVPRASKPGEINVYDVYLDELAFEIENNPELKEFYERVKNFNLKAEMKNAGYFPDAIMDVVSALFEARLKMLNQAFDKRKQGGKHESSYSL